ncbi:GDSL esterase/lipase At1g28570-like [Telopea speciosissima]|uniref:GDSL esterase/lipase At1g28570-like n=1 Tax=Telopea speciosissima TaxID=54955 RepID=UPI001CC433E2|nr:GDSL esterase/lipase At1g28570-like [Telopea speciosissima]
MAFHFQLYLPFNLQVLSIHILLILALANPHPVFCYYKSIFSFGDSLTDTGNLLRQEANNHTFLSRYPYGMTYFHHPTGRCSNGRLVVDFIAQYLGLPLLPPYLSLNSSLDFKQGVNFAVGGATALDNDFFRKRGIHNQYTNNSLGDQLGWFRELLPSLCHSSSGCRDSFRRSLFLIGEIGGNDYNHPLLQGISIEEVLSFVPEVIKAISSAIQTLIDHGAATLVVPGNFPIGCFTIYLSRFRSSNRGDYELGTGCLKWPNHLVKYHNYVLQKELDRLRKLYPNVSIIYADYYNAAMRFFRSPYQFGFLKGALAACCGGEGPYHYNSSVQCSYSGSTICEDPSLYVNWDGQHLTEAAYREIATSILVGPYTIPPLDISNVSLLQNI